MKDQETMPKSAIWMAMVLMLVAQPMACTSTPPPVEEAPAVEQPEPTPEEPEEPAEDLETDVIQEEEPAEEPEEDASEPEAEAEGEQVAAHVDARIAAALDDLEDGDVDDAVGALQRLMDEPDGGYLAAYNLGVIHDRRGDSRAALEHYSTALRRQPDFNPALINAARVYLRAGDSGQADGLVRQYIEERPDNLDHRATLLEIWVEQGRYEDVVEGARDILRRDVRHVEAMIQMATANYRLRRFELAEAILNRALQLAPERAEMYYLLAQVALAQDNDDVARVNFRRAIELQPRFPEARNNYAVMLYKAGNFQRAIEHLEASLKDAPHDPRAHVNLGNAHKALGNYADAEASYQAALDLDDRNGDAHFNLGILYLEAPVPGYEDLDRYEAAIASFQAYRDAVGQREASASPIATYINQATAAIEDEQERQEALRQAQMQHDGGGGDDDDGDESSEE